MAGNRTTETIKCEFCGKTMAKHSYILENGRKTFEETTTTEAMTENCPSPRASKENNGQHRYDLVKLGLL